MSTCYRYQWQDSNNREHLLLVTPNGNALQIDGQLVLTPDNFDAKVLIGRFYDAQTSKLRLNTPYSTQGVQDIKLVEKVTNERRQQIS